MKMNLRYKLILGAILLTLVAAPFAFTARADHDDDTTFRARLNGFGEVPPKLLDGTGRFNARLSPDGNTISWTLSWTGLTGSALVAHVHFGQAQNVGSPVVFFCGGGGKPACPAGTSASITGTWTAADVVAVPSQNVSAGDFAGLVRILRANLGYANVHTALFGGGEIRGQVMVRDDDHDDK